MEAASPSPTTIRYFLSGWASLRPVATARARPWVAHDQFYFADMLLRRNASGDRQRALLLMNNALNTAQDLGMQKIIERALSMSSKTNATTKNTKNTKGTKTNTQKASAAKKRPASKPAKKPATKRAAKK